MSDVGTPLDNPQHETFALVFVSVFGNAAEAARRAGYPVDSARQRGHDLLQRAEVLDRIEELAAHRFATAKIDASTVLAEMVRVALCNPKDAFNSDDTLKSIHDIPDDVARAISSIKVEELFEGHGPARKQVGWTKEIKFWTKTGGLEMLARTLAMFKDSLTVKDERDQIDENMRAARVAALVELAARRKASGSDLA